MNDSTPPQQDTAKQFAWQWAKRLVACIVLLVLFVVGWAAIHRMQAHRHAVVVHRSEAPQTTETAPDMSASQPFTVVAYNIAHARGPAYNTDNWTGDRTKQLRQLGNAIDGFDVDVVVLNEVDFDATWSHRVNQAQAIAHHTPHAHWVSQVNYDVSLPGFRMQFGNVVLSKWPIVSARRITLPKINAWEETFVGGKDALAVVLDVGGQPVQLLAVHLDVRSQSLQRESIAMLNQAITEFEQTHDGPTIVAGDVNGQWLQTTSDRTASPWPHTSLEANTTSPIGAWLASDALQWLPKDQWTEGFKHPQGSFPTVAPNRLIDLVASTPDWPMASFEVLDTDLSDHLPVRGTWILSPKASLE